MIFLILMTLHTAAASLKPGKTRDGLIHFLRLGIPRLEFCLRCLLAGMRAKPTAPKPAPFTPRRESVPGSARLPRRAPGFSLSLKGIAPANAPPPTRIIPDAAKPRSAPFRQECEDPFALRLRNIRSVLNNPAIFAQKIAASLARRGLRLRAAKTLRPAADLWQLFHKAAPGTSFHLPETSRPDTS